MADVSPAETVLALLKADLGVTHTKRDEYFAALITPRPRCCAPRASSST